MNKKSIDEQDGFPHAAMIVRMLSSFSLNSCATNSCALI